jgi:DNA-binding IclR family transcriptional regulator
MSRKPSSLNKKHAERLTERSGVLGQTAAALNVLCCFDGCSVGCVQGATRSTNEIVTATGRPKGAVERQIGQLMRLGYLERASDGRYRLSERLLGETEVVANSLRHSSTTAHIRIEGDKGTSSTAS